MIVKHPDTGEDFVLDHTNPLSRDLQIHSKKLECSHTETAVVDVAPRNGARQIRRQCRKCGELTGPAVARASVSTVEEHDTQRFDLWEAARLDDYQRVIDKHVRWQSGDSERRYSKYQEYLRSPEWAAIRAKVIKRAGGVCEGCLDRPATQAHHLHYQTLFREFCFDLVAVCSECHERYHKIEDETRGRGDPADGATRHEPGPRDIP
jgi:5-methylcytosine-specific restriction endonuclease McrA